MVSNRGTCPGEGACWPIDRMDLRYGNNKGLSDSVLHSVGKLIHRSRGIILHEEALSSAV